MIHHTLIAILILFLITAFAQKSSPNQSEKWWKETVFYQIYMPSFQNSEGNGISDFVGMTTRLDYLQSPKVDNGYDVADYYKIDPAYCTMENFRNFLNEAHKRHIKVIMDMVLNQTSTDCKWFQ